MKIIKVFLASSEELAPEREKVTDLIYQLNKLFKSRGVELDLEKWEYLDSSVSVNFEKQDDYNEVLKECEVCIVVFWRKFGRFTGKEFEIARQQLSEGKNPRKIYIFFKDLDKEDDITPELLAFKQSIYDHYGHFYCKFANVDTMKLDIVMQLELYLKGLLGENTIVVRQGNVYVDDVVVANLSNVAFVANDQGFVKMQEDLKGLKGEIAKKQAELEKKQQRLLRKKARLEEHPEDEDNKEEYEELLEEIKSQEESLQEKLDRKNQLEEEFERKQQDLFNTARRIAEMRTTKITKRMARAIEVFENGDAKRADAILDEAEHDAEEALSDLVIAQKTALLSLEELVLKASLKMDNDSIPIEDRIQATRDIFEKADALAKQVGYEKKKYVLLLRDYAEFLKKRDMTKALELYLRQEEMYKEIYGPDNIHLAMSYDDIAFIYMELGGESNWNKSRSYLEKALAIQKLHLEQNHPNIANTYRLMGLLQLKRLNYQESMECFQKAIGLFEETVGGKSMELGMTYRDLARLYEKMFKKDKTPDSYQASLKYHHKAIDVMVKLEGEENVYVLAAYNNLAILYSDNGEYDEALQLHVKAIGIKERVLGHFNISTAIEYNNMGNVYHNLKDYGKAMDCYSTSLEIKMKVLSPGDYSFSNTYKRMGVTSLAMGRLKEARDFLSMALQIRESQLNENDERIKDIRDFLAQC